MESELPLQQQVQNARSRRRQAGLSHCEPPWVNIGGYIGIMEKTMETTIWFCAAHEANQGVGGIEVGLGFWVFLRSFHFGAIDCLVSGFTPNPKP